MRCVDLVHEWSFALQVYEACRTGESQPQVYGKFSACGAGLAITYAQRELESVLALVFRELWSRRPDRLIHWLNQRKESKLAPRFKVSLEDVWQPDLRSVSIEDRFRSVIFAAWDDTSFPKKLRALRDILRLEPPKGTEELLLECVDYRNHFVHKPPDQHRTPGEEALCGRMRDFNGWGHAEHVWLSRRLAAYQDYSKWASATTNDVCQGITVVTNWYRLEKHLNPTQRVRSCIIAHQTSMDRLIEGTAPTWVSTAFVVLELKRDVSVGYLDDLAVACEASRLPLLIVEELSAAKELRAAARLAEERLGEDHCRFVTRDRGDHYDLEFDLSAEVSAAYEKLSAGRVP